MKFDGKLSLIFTIDEERDGFYGMSLALEHLREIGDLPKFYIAAEPIYDKKI